MRSEIFLFEVIITTCFRTSRYFGSEALIYDVFMYHLYIWVERDNVGQETLANVVSLNPGV